MQYKEKRLYGDCRLICLSKILEKNNIFLSSTMCFGIGQGYDFSYWIDRSTKVPMLISLGRNLETEYTVCNNIGISLIEESQSGAGQGESMSLMDSYIRQKVPLYINVDRYYLPYLNDKYNSSHFGYHTILVDSFEERDGSKQYKVYDPVINTYANCTEKEIKLARGSKWQPFTPNYGLYYIYSDSNKINISYEIIENAILSNSIDFLMGKNRGVNALNKFINEIETLNRSHSESAKFKVYIKLQFEFISKYILEFENTQSFYRKLFAEFLKEVNEKFGQAHFSANIDEFDELGDAWQNLAIQLKKKEDIKEKISIMIENLKEIAIKEQHAVKRLQSAVS